MALSKITKIVIGATSIGSATGGLAYGYYALTPKETIKDKLSNTLLWFEDKYSDKWKERAVILRKANSGLSKELEKVKAGADADGSRIKVWCQENIENNFASDKDQNFLEVQNCCTYNIKDKIENPINLSSWDDSKHNKKLKELPETVKLSTAMKEIKTKISGDSPTKKDALKEWCTGVYDKPFKNDKDKEFSDAKEYCSYKE